MFDMLYGKKLFSNIGLESDYHEIRILTSDQ